MKSVIALLLALIMIFTFTTAAFAEAAGTVYAAYGSSKIRSGPGLSYSESGVLKKGNSLEYAGSTEYDE